MTFPISFLFIFDSEKVCFKTFSVFLNKSSEYDSKSFLRIEIFMSSSLYKFSISILVSNILDKSIFAFSHAIFNLFLALIFSFCSPFKSILFKS